MGLSTALLLTALLACAPSGPQGDLQVSAILAPNPDNPFSVLATLESNMDVFAQIAVRVDGEVERATPGFGLEVGVPLEQLVLGLHADTRFDLELLATDGRWSWTLPLGEHTTSPLTEDLDSCEASSPFALESFDRDEAICTNGPSTEDGLPITCFDRSGRPFWQLHQPGETLFLMQALSDGSFAVGSLTTSRIHRYDGSGHLIRSISMLDLEDATLFEHSFLNPHDFIEITEGPWAGSLALLTTCVETLSDGQDYAGTGIVVYDHRSDEVLWDWSILGAPGDGMAIEEGLEELDSCEHNPNCLHANSLLHSVDALGQQRFWIGLNGPSLFFSVDVTTATLGWALGAGGDFELVDDLDSPEPLTLGPEAWMYQAHGPELQGRMGDRSRVLLFDNGTERPSEQGDAYSRVLELEIDEATMRAAPVFSYGTDDPDAEAWFYSPMSGDVDMLPDGDSFMFIKGDQDIFIAEISYPEGHELWRLSCPGWQGAYRLSYFPNLYRTEWSFGTAD